MGEHWAIDRDLLLRDWIAGTAGEALLRRIEKIRYDLSGHTAAVRARGLCVSLEDPVEFSCVFLAAVSIDFPVILANPRWGQREWSQLSELVQPAVVRGRAWIDTSKAPPRQLEPGSILIPTGGSTGGVKLAIHDWSSLTAGAKGVVSFLGGDPMHACCVLPLFHVSGLMQIVRSIVSGGRVRFDDLMVEAQCLSLVPTQLQRALNDPDSIRRLATAKAIFVGGGPIPGTVAAQAAELQLPVIPVYGMTETAAMVAAVPNADFLTDPEAPALPIGEAAFQIEADSRIRIQTPALFKGYQGQPPIDQMSGWLCDDLGELTEEGRLRVHGRADRLIISGGEKVDPDEVEKALRSITGIREAAVVSKSDLEWGEMLIAYCVPESVQPSFAEIKATLSTQLAHFKIPKQVEWVETLPVSEKERMLDQ